MEVDGNSHAVKSVLAIVATDEKQRLGVETLAEDFGKSFADPLQAGLVGGVVEGEDEHGLGAGRALGSGDGREKKQERGENPIAERVQSAPIINSCFEWRVSGAAD
jgi:hypothetical protein